MSNKILCAGMLSLLAGPALAGEPCRSAKDLANLGQSFYGAGPDLKDVVTPVVKIHLKSLNDDAAPTAILYRHEGKEEILPVIDGHLTEIERTANWSKDGEMCRMTGDELSPTTEEDSVEANMSFSFPYKRRDGVFTIDELKEGAKDGSKMMKGLAPGGLGFVVPGMKAISLQPADGAEVRPVYEFSRKGETVDVDSYQLGTQTLIRLKDIKSAKADTLKIQGQYELGATFKFDPEAITKAEAERLEKEALEKETQSEN